MPLSIHEKGGRPHFEDYILPELGKIEENDQIFIVSDGTGSGKLSVTAAELVAQNFAEYFEILPPGGEVDEPYMDRALEWVEESLSTYIQGNSSSRGMTASVALLHFGEKLATLAWVGDSRIYYFDSKRKKLSATEDHSVVNDLIQRGKITPEEASTHKDRHRLLRAIQGSESPTRIDTKFIPIKNLHPGDFFLICNDGLLESLNDSDLLTIFTNLSDPIAIQAEIRRRCAKNRDNYSCHLLPVASIDKKAVLNTPPVASADTGEPTRVESTTEAAPAPVPETSPIPVETTNGLLSSDWVVYSLIAALGLSLFMLVFWVLGENDADYEALMSRGTANLNVADYPLAVAQFDSAWQEAGNPAEKSRAIRLRDKAARSMYLVEISDYESEATYPAYMLALGKVQEAIQNYGDEQDSLFRTGKRLDEKIALIQTNDALPQLLAAARAHCENGDSDIAEVFFAEADKLGESGDSQNQVSQAREACHSTGQLATTPVTEEAPEQELIAEAESSQERAIPSANTDAKLPRKTSPTVVRETEDPSPVADKRVATPRSLAPAPLKETSAGSANTRSTSTGNTSEQQAALAKGKALFQKAVQSKSKYEYKKSAEYLEAAGSALDGQGNLMLAQLYSKGIGVDQNLKKGLEFARKSALQGSPDGHYLYAHLLLLRLNPGDTLTAKKSLRIAVDKGNREAELRLGLLQH